MRLFFRRIHLYLGLAAGLVLTVTCGTGAVLVFEEELQHLLHHDRYFVKQSGAQRLSVEDIRARVEAARPGVKVTGVKLYTDRGRTAEVTYTPAEKQGAKAKTARQQSAPQQPTGVPPAGKKPERAAGAKKEAKREGGARAFVNPYTGAVVEWYNYRETGFYTVFALHRWLLAESAGGKTVVGISTLIFLFIIGTGLVLWWPKNKAILKQRLRIKTWRGKRGVHDLHVVLGFWASIPLFIFAFTGLAWSFEWFNNGVYRAMGSSPEPPKPPKSAALSGASSASADTAIAQVLGAERGGVVFWQAGFPKDSTAALTVTVLPASASIESATTAYHFDQYSGRLIKRVRYEDRSRGQQVRSAFKPVHTGAVWGWPSKIIAALACAVGTTMPLTGTILWWNRTRKKRRAAGS